MSSRFDLEKAISAWRRSLEYNPALLWEDVDELESHVRDQVRGLVLRGLSDEEAFERAVRQMGSYGKVESEYQKVYWGKVRRRHQFAHELTWRVSMFKNYLKTAFRTLFRQKGYTFINVAGLATGLAFCTLIFLYVRDELSYDRFHEKADRIFRVNAVSQNPEGDFYRTAHPPPLAPALQAEFPELEAVTRIVPRNRVLIRVGDEVYQETRFYLADAFFFKVFSFPFLSGGPEAVLMVPGTVVFTETMARKYFGDTDPLGQVITFENGIELTVAGVIEDVPSNSHLAFDFLAALDTPGMAQVGWLGNWRQSSTSTYVLLQPDAMPEVLEAKLPGFVDTYLAETLDESEIFTLSLQKLSSIHLYPHLPPEQIWAASNLRYVYLFSIMGLAVLLIACINYVNLATARALRRAREVGVRKILGSTRRQLLGQFLGEASLVAGAALLLALLLVVLSAPAFNTLTGKTFSLAELGDFYFLLGLLGIWVLVSLGAGGYPALYLSSFRPTDALRRLTLSGQGGFRQRNVLVVVQFAATVLMVVGTLTVYEQLAFMRNKSLGYDEEQVLVVPLRDTAILQNMEALKQEWLNISGVSTVAFSSGVPNAVGGTSTAGWEGADEDGGLEVNHIMVDRDFMEVFGFEVVAGRGFSSDFPGDAAVAYVLNEAAVQAIGWDEPVGKNLEIGGNEAPVIGIVKDFHYQSLHQPIGPIVLHFQDPLYRMASLKLRPEQVQETLEAVEAVFQRVSPDRPFEYYFLDETFDNLYRSEERFGRISAYVTALALLLACLGLLGLTASVVEYRTKEVGIRKVLGATVPGIVRLLSTDFLKLVGIAFIVAAPLAYFVVQRWLEDFAYRIQIGPGIFLVTGVLVLFIALLTVSYQSVKAALADPVKSLRYE
jgi:putative ABC transport system permease protein